MTWLDDATVVTAEDKAAEATEQARQQAKAERDSALNNIVHDFGDGRVMQVRPQDLENISLAIEMGVNHQWIMADNSVQTVTTEDLQAARVVGITQGQAIWTEYTDTIKALA